MLQGKKRMGKCPIKVVNNRGYADAGDNIGPKANRLPPFDNEHFR
jgi:hypothetical protein